jgi:hypothetical protein
VEEKIRKKKLVEQVKETDEAAFLELHSFYGLVRRLPLENQFSIAETLACPC